LSPAYDLLNVNLANTKDKEELALSMEGKKRKFTRHHFERFGTNLGLNKKQIQEMKTLRTKINSDKTAKEYYTLTKKQMDLANVTAQSTLAKEIGENENYQSYLVKIREVEIMGEVNKVQYQSLATALAGADLKLLVNSGDVHSGLGKFSDILSSKGGSVTNGLFESLKQTPEGSGIVSLLEQLGKKSISE
jgi:hypothetical protein